MSRLFFLFVLALISCPSVVLGHFFGYDPFWQQRAAYQGAIAQQQQALGAQQVLIDQQNAANQQAIQNQQMFDQQVGQQMDFQQQQIAGAQQTQADAAQQTLQTAQQQQAVVFQQQQQAQLAAQQLAQAQAVVNQQKRQTQIVQAQAATAARQASQAAAKTQADLEAARQATAQLLAQQAAQAALPPEEQQRSAALLHQIQLQKDQDIVNKEAAAQAASMNSAMNLQQAQEQAKLAQFQLDQQLRAANAAARKPGTPAPASAMDAIDADSTDAEPTNAEFEEQSEEEVQALLDEAEGERVPEAQVDSIPAPSQIKARAPLVAGPVVRSISRRPRDDVVDGTSLTREELISIIMDALDADEAGSDPSSPVAEIDSAATVADTLTVNSPRTPPTDEHSTDASRDHTSLVIGVSVAGGSLLLILFLFYFGRSYYLARREKNELESARRAAQGNLPLPYGHPLQVV